MQIRQHLLPTPLTNVWTSGAAIHEISNISDHLPSDWIVNDLVNISRTPEVYTNFEEQDELSAFEESMKELLKDGLVTSGYVQDVFQQEQVFKDNFERIRIEFPDKDIVVCGGEIFVGETLKDAERKAHDKYKNRPTYSYSPTVEL